MKIIRPANSWVDLNHVGQAIEPVGAKIISIDRMYSLRHVNGRLDGN